MGREPYGYVNLMDHADRVRMAYLLQEWHLV